MDFGVSAAKVSQLKAQMSACGVTEADLEERFIRSQGPGGQHVNKTSTCVELKHLPSGHTVKMQKARSQPLNRFYARRRLCELLEQDQLGQESAEAKRVAKLKKQKDRRRRRARTRGR